MKQDTKWLEMKKHFEANMLDGDEVQEQGQMINANCVWEYILENYIPKSEVEKIEREAIERTFPHLYSEYDSYTDEMYCLEQSSDFDSFFRHDRVVKYLAELEEK